MPARIARLLLSVLLILPLAAFAQAPIEGEDYRSIDGGAPYAPAKGRIEVVEVFGYTCPHCARFEPMFAAWAARQPKDVQVVRLAAPWGGHWQPYARAFYAARALGALEKTHAAVFRALHEDGALPLHNATAEEIAGFYARYGVDPRRFAATMQSAAIDSEMQKAQAFILRSGVEGTPTLIVAGKYRVTARSHADALRIAEHLVARERAARR